MTVFLAANPRDGQVQTFRNTGIVSLEVQAAGGRLIDGVTSRYLTPGSTANYVFEAAGNQWWTLSGVFRPIIQENNVPGLSLPITTDTSLIDIVLPVPGIFDLMGTLIFNWSGGNNQFFRGIVEFEVAGVPVPDSSIPFGMGRASTDADWPLTIAIPLNNNDGSYTNQTINVIASNIGDGTITLDAPAYIDWKGPQ